MTSIRWSRQSVRDLLEIGDFIALDDPIAARRWVDRLRAKAGRAAALPRAARIVPELGRDDVREVYLKSYRIVFQLIPRAIVVLTIFEGHRRFPVLKRDDEPR